VPFVLRRARGAISIAPKRPIGRAMLIDFLTGSIAAVLFVIQILGFVAAGHAVMNSRSTQGTIAWAISLATFPIIALPAYLLLGRTRFEGYLKMRRRGAEQVLGLSKAVLDAIPQMRSSGDPGGPRNFNVLGEMVSLPFSRWNRPELLIDGEATFGSILGGIRAARRYVLVSFFIVRSDRIGNELRQLLIAKAREGVRVYFLYDEIGSRSLPRAYVESLRAGGVEVCSFGTGTRIRNYLRLRLNFRNHRKIVVADGIHAWVGGHNVGDEYLGRHPKFGPWRDTHIKLTGPAVLAVQLAFVEDWNWATQKVLRLDWPVCPPIENGCDVLVIPSGPSDRRETFLLALLHLIQSARTRLWFHSPYFVPDDTIVAALQLAALRGVDVRIMLPERPDHILVWLSSFYFISLDDLADVRFFRYRPGFLHSKAILIDDDVAAIGTANLDNRSFRINFELTVLTVSREFAREVETMMLRDFEGADEVTPADYHKRPLPFRVAAQAARLLSPIQ